MPELSKPYETYEKPGMVLRYRLSKVRVFKGALVAVDSFGLVVPINPTMLGLRFVGVANETVDNTDADPGRRSILVTKCGSFVFKCANSWSPRLTELGREVVAVSDWEVGLWDGSSGRVVVGTVVGIESTSVGTPGVRVRIDKHTC